MRIKTILATAIVVACVLSACNRNVVKLDYTNAKGEVPVLGNLVFRFSNSLMKDSLLNEWDSTDYISFEPSIAGRFRWESPDQLVFSPARPLLPATSYKAKLGKNVLRFSKYGDISNADAINFHTPALSLDNATVTWVLADDQSRQAIPRIDLYFNYRINPADLRDKLSVEIEGKKAGFVTETETPGNKISLQVNTLGKTQDKNYEAKIIIAKGLKPAEGNNETTDAITSDVSIPSPYVLSIQNVESEHDGDDGVITVTTSQQLTGDNLSSLVSFTPGLRYTTEVTDDGFVIRSSGFDVEKSYAFTIKAGLRGKIGGVLKEAYNGNVAFGELESNITFASSKAVYLSKQGGKNVEVKITNVPKIKVIISKIYENNLLMAQRYGYDPRETRQADDNGNDENGEGGDGYGSEEYAAYTDGATTGDIVYEKVIDTRSLPQSGAGRILNLSQFEDRLPEFRGIYHVMVRSTKDYWVRDSRFISLSDLGLIAKQGQDKIYVFANSVKTTNGLEGVNVSVYSNNNQLIGAGVTDATGVAAVAFTRKDFSGFKP
ncbi:MAG TPA: hypothetical protein VGC95_06385, partial [Chitinophagaceae bacterium]